MEQSMGNTGVCWDNALVLMSYPIWKTGSNDYYRTPSGRIVTQWPRPMSALERTLASLGEDAYESATRAAVRRV